MKRFKLTSGFTLVELLVVISVIAILATAGLVGLRGAQIAGRDAKRLSDVAGLRPALEVYYTQTGSYPTGLSLLAPSIVTVVPSPPPPGPATYGYGSCTAGQDYNLGAQLERDNLALDSDYDSGGPCGASAGTVSCADASFGFCVTN